MTAEMCLLEKCPNVFKTLLGLGPGNFRRRSSDFLNAARLVVEKTEIEVKKIFLNFSPLV